ncbi:MAG: rod shape-determining protein MreD [bacterium]|nr:rod shape-determining protein MreD [bacterium]
MAAFSFSVGRWLPWTIRIVLAVALVAAQVSLLPALPFVWIARMNLLVVLTVYVAATAGARRALAIGIASGFFYDLYRPTAFGVHAVSLMAAVAAVDICARRLVTNQTLPALLALGMIASVTALAATWLGTWVSTIAALSVWPWSVATWRWWLEGAYGIAGQVTVLAVVFAAKRGGVWASGSSHHV